MKSQSWRIKLLSLFIAVLTVSLVLQLFYVVPYIEDQEVQNAEVLYTEIARDMAQDLDNGLNNLLNVLTVIANRPEFQNMDIAAQTRIEFQYVHLVPNLDSLFVMNETGWFVSSTTEDLSIYTKKSYDYLDSFTTAFKYGEIYFAAPSSRRNNTLVSTHITVPIELESGERVGVLTGTMRLNDFIQNFANYPIEEDQLAFIINLDGTVVAHSEIDLFTLEEGPLSLNYSTHYVSQKIMNGETNTTYKYDHNGTTFIGTNVILQTNGWGVVLETPLDKILAESNILARRLWVFNIVLFIGALFISVIFTNQITSERKRTQRELKDIQDKLVRREQLAVIGQLAGGVGHELRNPLAAIKNAIYFLNMVITQPDTKVKEMLELIEKEIATSERIISDLLDYARVKPPTLQKIDLNKVIWDSLNNITIPKNIEVIDKLDNTLPKITADPHQLDQVFVNLLLNAIQAMPDGGQLIIKSVVDKSEGVEISIMDTGEGIPKENQEKIFEPLFTTKARGIGMGLAIVHARVTGHDGTIDLQSEVGIGSIFTIKLPLVDNEEK